MHCRSGKIKLQDRRHGRECICNARAVRPTKLSGEGDKGHKAAHEDPPCPRDSTPDTAAASESEFRLLQATAAAALLLRTTAVRLRAIWAPIPFDVPVYGVDEKEFVYVKSVGTGGRHVRSGGRRISRARTRGAHVLDWLNNGLF